MDRFFEEKANVPRFLLALVNMPQGKMSDVFSSEEKFSSYFSQPEMYACLGGRKFYLADSKVSDEYRYTFSKLTLNQYLHDQHTLKESTFEDICKGSIQSFFSSSPHLEFIVDRSDNIVNMLRFRDAWRTKKAGDVIDEFNVEAWHRKFEEQLKFIEDRVSFEMKREEKIMSLLDINLTPATNFEARPTTLATSLYDEALPLILGGTKIKSQKEVGHVSVGGRSLEMGKDLKIAICPRDQLAKLQTWLQARGLALQVECYAYEDFFGKKDKPGGGSKRR